MKLPIKEIAFFLYPVRDVKKAREFYEGTLGLTCTANWQDAWVEYDIGAGTLAISTADEQHKPGAQGATVGLEVEDFEKALGMLAEAGVKISSGPHETPVCRLAFIRDPDGNELIIHKRKE